MIRFQRPELPPAERIADYFDLALEARWFSNSGPCCRLLQERLSDRVGAYCTPVASGTLGLMTALAAVLGERRGGTAVMPSFTFVATPQAALWSGLRPLLGDIHPEHWHLAADDLEASLRGTDVPRVAIAVSAFGTPPPAGHRERWEQACRAAQVPLVVDSAAGFGAIAEDGVPIGAQGDVEVVSFHATKPFAIGEGGAVFTRSQELHERIQREVNFGFDADHTSASARGLNAKMSELHAATALAVLDDFDRVLEQRGTAAKLIRDEIGGGDWQVGAERSTSQFVPLAFASAAERARVLADCQGKVEVRTYYQPVQELIPTEVDCLPGGTPLALDLHSRLLCLPMANDLSDDEVRVITSAVVA